MQVCYPKIYRMLATSPNFTNWDENIAQRLNIQLPKDNDVKRKDIKKIQNNTGNGGFFVFLPKDGSVEVILRPKVLSNKISLEILLSTQVKRPDALTGKSFDEMLQNDKVAKMLSNFDNIISPLLKDVYYFEGHTYPETGMGTYFKSFSDEQAYRCSQGWQPNHISQNVEYRINLTNESLFEDKAVIETIADVVIANYDLRVLSQAVFPFMNKNSKSCLPIYPLSPQMW